MGQVKGRAYKCEVYGHEVNPKSHIKGIAGPDYKFITTDVGTYGKESDGGIFSNSNFSGRLEKGELHSQKLAPLPGMKVLRVLIGDEACPLKHFLVRSIPASQLGTSQTIINKCISKSRQVIDCAFGIITSKWRMLKTGIESEL